MTECHFIREHEFFVDASVLGNGDGPLPPGAHRLNHETFDALESLILENRVTGSADALEIMALGARQDVGRIITARNYVGVIQLLDGTSVQILPKIDTSDASAGRRVLANMLRAVIDLPLKDFDLASLETARTDVLEPLVRMFVRAVSRLARRGLSGAYDTTEDNERFFKGKVDFAQDLRLNVAHRERHYVSYDEFSINRAENRIILETLHLLRAGTRSHETRREIARTLEFFTGVERPHDVERDFALCKIDRNMGAYQSILEWCRVFLRRESFISFAGSKVASSLLFPMERLFERYVARMVRSEGAKTQWHVTAQDHGRYLFDEPRRFMLRPDIVMRREGILPVILDTKWKTVGDGLGGISQADMYQMYVYQHRYETSKSIVIYPMQPGMDVGLLGEYRGWSRGGHDSHIQLFAYDLEHPRESARQLVSIAEM